MLGDDNTVLQVVLQLWKNDFVMFHKVTAMSFCPNHGQQEHVTYKQMFTEGSARGQFRARGKRGIFVLNPSRLHSQEI